jgi:hypothetical protein
MRRRLGRPFWRQTQMFHRPDFFALAWLPWVLYFPARRKPIHGAASDSPDARTAGFFHALIGTCATPDAECGANFATGECNAFVKGGRYGAHSEMAAGQFHERLLCLL